LVAIVALFSLSIGWMLVYGLSFPPKARSYKVGVAAARMLVDTPQSQVVEVAPKGSDTLGTRASVLSNLMLYGELKAMIEQKAGVRKNTLIAGSDTTGGAEAVSPLKRDSFALTTGVVVNTELDQLPLIKVDVQAPTAAQAAKLADSAVNSLIGYVNSKADSQAVVPQRRLRITGLGPAQAHTVARGTGKIMGFAATIFVFLLGCTIIVAVSTIVRAWRAAVDLERKFKLAEDDEHAEVVELFDDDPRSNRGKKRRAKANVGGR
jgi:hypothetical protein